MKRISRIPQVRFEVLLLWLLKDCLDLESVKKVTSSLPRMNERLFVAPKNSAMVLSYLRYARALGVVEERDGRLCTVVEKLSYPLKNVIMKLDRDYDKEAVLQALFG